MVLESLISTKTAERKWWRMFFFGGLYALVGIVLSMWIFGDQASMVLVFLTSFACIPLIYHTLKHEEKVDQNIPANEPPSWKTHRKAMYYFTMLFLGFVVVFSLFAIFLPESTVYQEVDGGKHSIGVFSSQIDTIKSINGRTTGAYSSSEVLVKIVLNNINVLLFSIFFSFFFGAGAIFILTWNASVIAAAIGNYARNFIAGLAGGAGAAGMAAYFGGISLGFCRYMIHGMFEIVAYFIGGLAGGIISVAIIRHEIGSPEFKKVLKDALYLFAVALIFILVGGLIEVFFTPVMIDVCDTVFSNTKLMIASVVGLGLIVGFLIWYFKKRRG